MRRILAGFAVAAFVAVVPTLALAENQELANQIAQRLRSSGQLSGYKIGVKCQDGTAWLRGQVADEEQRSAALKLAFQTPGVTRVVNELKLTPATAGESTASDPVTSPSQGRGEERSARAGLLSRNPLRGKANAAHADRVASSFASTPVETVSAREEVPEPMTSLPRAKPMTQYMAMQPCPRGPGGPNGGPLPMYTAAMNGTGAAPARYDQPCLPNYAWPSYAAYPNYAAVTYPKQYSPTAWPYIGPFYPYPQVPLGWRKVTLEWDDGWWFLDFKDQPASCWHR
jgi:hypothetical protein